MSPLDHVTEAATKAESFLDSILGSATGDDVYGPITTVGSRVVIPVAAIDRAGGFGFGGGGGTDNQKNEGGGVGVGGGGASTARSVAIIEIDENGVRVRPALDFTRIVLAALSAVLVLRRLRRPK